jgi:hypothetical protein
MYQFVVLANLEDYVVEEGGRKGENLGTQPV